MNNFPCDSTAILPSRNYDTAPCLNSRPLALLLCFPHDADANSPYCRYCLAFIQKKQLFFLIVPHYRIFALSLQSQHKKTALAMMKENLIKIYERSFIDNWELPVSSSTKFFIDGC